MVNCFADVRQVQPGRTRRSEDAANLTSKCYNESEDRETYQGGCRPLRKSLGHSTDWILAGRSVWGTWNVRGAVDQCALEVLGVMTMRKLGT